MRLSGIFLALTMAMGIISNPGFDKAIERSVGTRVTISFVGDCTISTNQGGASQGSLNWYAENYAPTYFFEKVADVFLEDDFTVANCETVLSDRSLPKKDKGEGTAFWFVGPTDNAKIFSSSGVEILSVANNHAMDYGTQGYKDTVSALEAEDLTVLERNEPVYLEKNDIKIGMVSESLWYSGQEKALCQSVKDMAENSDIQIVYLHGGTEGLREPESWRVSVFRKLVDCGADLVVASHAHKLQPIEEYNGGTIVYGLGNFCFGGNRYPENRTAIFRYTFIKRDDGTANTWEVLPCYVYTGSSNNWQPALMEKDDPNYQKVIDFMNGKISSPV